MENWVYTLYRERTHPWRGAHREKPAIKLHEDNVERVSQHHDEPLNNISTTTGHQGEK